MRYISHGFLFQYPKGGIPYLYHRIMKAAVLFIAILASFIKVKAYARQHGDRTVYEPYDPCQRYPVCRQTEVISAAFPFLAVKNSFLFELKEYAFEEF